jgi:hypothetical protein
VTPPEARRAWYRGIVREFGKRGAKAHWHENRHDLLTGTAELESLYRQYLATIQAARLAFALASARSASSAASAR